MALLGEIVKNTQALRYHAKSSEIAGKNLSHVNDENYARQRVTSHDGSMYREVGGLGTTALEMGGLDHARSSLLDRRVVAEVGESATLEAREEILDLLQAVLGERVVREGVNVGLDDQLDSDLAPGSLTRALNDFFNAFQELSAAPDEPTIHQELFHKVHTLGKRFNEAGEKFEDIERDLTATVRQSVVQVNAILEKLHEVNKQVRRFELQDKGKAATYRDRRQQLLESLARHLAVKVEDDMDPTTGQASGLLNLFVTGAKGEKINLLDPKGPKLITTDWGQELTIAAPGDTNGTAAKVRAKIGADGKLGQIEILDGGSRYSDKNGPVIVAFAPPERKEIPSAQAEQVQAAADGAGNAGEAVNQAGQPVDRGPDIGNEVGNPPAVEEGGDTDLETIPAAPADLFKIGAGYDPAEAAPTVTITADKGTLEGTATINPDGTLNIAFSGTPSGAGNLSLVVTGGSGSTEPISLFEDSADAGATASDATAPFAYDTGEVFHYQDNENADEADDGSYYQALQPTAKGDKLSDESKFIKLSSIPNGTVVREFLWKYSDLESYDKGEQFYHEGKLYQATSEFSPVVDEVGLADAQSVLSTSQVYSAGDVMLHKGTYYQAFQTVQRLQSLPTSTTKGEIDNDFLVLGASLPSIDMAEEEAVTLNRATDQALTQGQFLSVKDLNRLDQVAIAGGGAGYKVGDKVDFSNPAGSPSPTINAEGEVATIDATGAITGITITNYGSGYGTEPIAAVTSFTGSGATLTSSITTNNKHYIARKDFNTGGALTPFDPAAKDPVTGALIHADKLIEVETYVDKSVKTIDRTQSVLSYKDGDILYDPPVGATPGKYYLVKRSFPELYGPQLNSTKKVESFDPSDPMWESSLREIYPQSAGTDPTEIVRRANRDKFDPEAGRAVEVNLGLAEAILHKGEIVGFSMLGEGKGYPPPDSLFINGLELDLLSGAIHGYQRLRLEEMEVFRQHLNGLAKDFVTQVNQVYNPGDEPGGYIFGFDGFLSRSVQRTNDFMEEFYGLTGVEGDGDFILYRDEVDLVVPYPEKDTFQVTYAAPIYPEELSGQAPYIRNGPDSDAEALEELGDAAKIYASARSMKHVTIEQDREFAGDDGILGTQDDGRMIMSGYEKIPFRMEQGNKSFVFGDRFEFESVPLDSWNVAKSMRVNKGFTADNIKASMETVEGANDIALAIAEKGNGEFTDRVSAMNTAIGNSIADVHDNLEHQKAVERLLLDERQAVSSVSIDEEVADLMRFQRSFQASAKVLSTLDRMLELVVMGLIR